MYALDDDILCQLRATFKVEAAEHVQAMNRLLLALENNPGADEREALLEDIFREAHSLKGAAGAADVREVEATAHRIEDVLGAVRAGRVSLTHGVCNVLYHSLDAANTLAEAALADRPHAVNVPQLHMELEAIVPGRSNGAAPTAIEAAPRVPVDDLQTRRTPPNSTPEETLRIGTGKIDSLLAQASELLIAGLKIDQRVKEVEQVGRTLEAWQREWRRVRAVHNHLAYAGRSEEMTSLLHFLELNQSALRNLAAQIAELRRGFAHDALQLSHVSHDISAGVMQVRMLPVAAVFNTFPRLVRDLAHQRGKTIDFKLEGLETELDRAVLEAIKDPLLHLLRNAVDHGIEPPDVRRRAGKPHQGTIVVRAAQKGNRIVIEVADDGAGIDRVKAKQAALKAGLLEPAEADTLSDEAALRLIFTPGLSTSPIITDISGRGVGMDVVRKNVEALHGQVEVDSTPGRGTAVRLTLPLTLATTQQLLVRVNDQVYGIPIAVVERVRRIRRKDIGAIAGRPAITAGGEPLMLVRLADVLEQPETSPAGAPNENAYGLVVILNALQKRIGFLVDAVVGQQEAVVKSLGKQLARVRNVAGATILGSGRVIVTLNPIDLMKSVGLLPHRPATTPPRRVEHQPRLKPATLLVVDDSLSTRTLEKNILETAGYGVVTAADGLEAMALLTSNAGYDLIVSDVIMPRMNGFDLTAAVKHHPHLKEIPVVLVTSLDSRAEKERGIEVGADAYLVKGSFDQANLLETIEQLI